MAVGPSGLEGQAVCWSVGCGWLVGSAGPTLTLRPCVGAGQLTWSGCCWVTGGRAPSVPRRDRWSAKSPAVSAPAPSHQPGTPGPGAGGWRSSTGWGRRSLVSDHGQGDPVGPIRHGAGDHPGWLGSGPRGGGIGAGGRVQPPPPDPSQRTARRGVTEPSRLMAPSSRRPAEASVAGHSPPARSTWRALATVPGHRPRHQRWQRGPPPARPLDNTANRVRGNKAARRLSASAIWASKAASRCGRGR